MAGLAKLKLVIELDGDKAVVTGMERVDAAIDRTGRTSQTATERMAAGMGNVETATGKLAAGIGKAETATGKLESELNRLGYSVSSLTDLVEKAIAVFGLMKVLEFAKNTMTLAARYETLGVVMEVVGKNAGYTRSQMDSFQDGLMKTGISAIESRQGLALMAQAQVDFANSSKLARIAQDAAVIGNINSSEAFNRMMTGISTGQSILLHHLGLMTNFEQAYIDAAHAVGKTSNDLTNNEKAQIRVNEVIRAGVGIAGSYEAAMGTVGKQLTSMPRYINDLMVQIGSMGQGPLFTFVSSISNSLKYVSKHFEEISSVAGSFATGGLIIFFGLASSKIIDYAASLALASQHSEALRMNIIYNANAAATAAAATVAETEEELRRVTVMQAGIVAERESAIAKLQNASANSTLAASQLSLAETEAAQATARTAQINAQLALIATESASLKAKGVLTKSEADFSNELRNQEFTSRNRLIVALSEQSIAERNLATMQIAATKSAQAQTAATTELALVAQSGAVAETQLASATAAVALAEEAQTVAMQTQTAAMAEASVAGRVMTGVVGGLNTVLSLVGGPIGAIAIGIAGITYEIIKFNDRANEAQRNLAAFENQGEFSQMVQKLKEIENLTKQMENANKTPAEQAKASTVEIQDKINRAIKENISLEQQRSALIKSGNVTHSEDTFTGKLTEWDKVNAKIRENNNLIQYGTRINEEMTAAQAKLDALKKAKLTTNGAEGIDPDKQAQYDKHVREAALAVQHQYTRMEVALEADGVKQKLALLNQQHQLGLLTEKAYLDSKYDMQRAADMKELERLNAQSHAAYLVYDKTYKDPHTDGKQVDEDLKKYLEAVEQARKKAREINLLDALQPGVDDLAILKKAAHDTSVEFQSMFQIWESQQPEHNDLGYFLETNRDLIKQINSLQIDAGIVDANEQLRLMNSLLMEAEAVAPDMVDKINQAMMMVRYNSGQGSATDGMTVAIQEYGKESADVAKQVHDAWGNAFKGIEDAITNMVQHGKVDFRSLLQSIEADLIRMSIAKPVTNMIAQSIGGLAGSLGSTSSARQNAGNVDLNTGLPLATSTSAASGMGGMATFGIGAAVVGIGMVANSLFDLDGAGEAARMEMERVTKEFKDMATAAKSVILTSQGKNNEADITALQAKIDDRNKLAQADYMKVINHEVNKHWSYVADAYVTTSGQLTRNLDRMRQDIINNTDIGAIETTKYNEIIKQGEIELQQLKDNQTLTHNKLLLAEMELKGLKDSAHYTDMLTKIREAEMYGMDDTDKAIQRRIYALQDEAAAAEKAAAALTFTADLTTRLLTVSGQDKLSGLLVLQVKQEKELADARKNGMDTAMLVQVQQLEMANAMKTASETISDATQKIISTAKTALSDAVSLNTTILGTMRELLSGATAQLSPEAAYNQAKSQFATADASNISERVTAFMTASQSYNGSGQTYQTDRLAALDKLSQFAATAPTLSNVERQIQLLGEIKSAVESGDSALIAATQITYNAAQIDMGTATNALTIALEGIQSALNTPISAGTAQAAVASQLGIFQQAINTTVSDGTAKTAIQAQIAAMQTAINTSITSGTAAPNLSSQIAALQTTINTSIPAGTARTALLDQIGLLQGTLNTAIPAGTAQAAIQAEISALQAKLNTGVTGSAKDAIANSIGALQLALNGTISAATAQSAISTAYSVVQAALNGTISGTLAANSLATQYSITQAALNGTISSTAATQALQTVYGTVQGVLNGTISSGTATQAIGTVYATVQGALNGTVTGSAAASAIGSTYSTIQGALNGTISGATAAATIAGQYGSVTGALNDGLNVGTNSVSSMLDKFNTALVDSAATTQKGLTDFVNALAIVSDYTRQRTDAQTAIGDLSTKYRAGTISVSDYNAQAQAAVAPLNTTIAAGSSLGLTALSAPSFAPTSEDINQRMKTEAAGIAAYISQVMIQYSNPFSTFHYPYVANYDVNKNGVLDQGDLQTWTSILSGATKWTDLQGLPAFEAGTNFLPYDMIAQVHEGERIIPKADNYELMRRLDAPASDNKDVVAAIEKLEKRLERLEKLKEAAIRQAGAIGEETIATGKRQERNLENLANNARVAA